MQMKDYIIEFDILRGTATFLVVLYHYTTRYNISIGHINQYMFNLSWGYVGVIIFFTLSGFLTFLNLHDKDTIFSFIYKRIIRLYPVYWLSIIITTISMLFLLPDRVRSIPTILANFSMLQNFLGIDSVDGVYWTLSYEILFYFFVGIILLLKQKRNIVKIGLIGIIIAIIISVLRLYLDNIILSILYIFFLADYVHAFIA